MTVHAARDYQTLLKEAAFAFWMAGVRNVILVLPTGGGKSFVVAVTVSEAGVPAVVMAHRGELVVQLSVAMAREGVRHRVIGAANVSRTCTTMHMNEFNRSYVDPNARIAVASVDTLINMDPANPWFRTIGLWTIDEAHHCTKDNKWGRATKLFPNARGLGVTATPLRADGLGLGADADGVFEQMVVGPSMRELINRGFLSDYRIFAPPSDIDLSTVSITGSGDYSPEKLKAARRRSTITGDVVAHYLRLAPGKLGVTFDTDLDSAVETAAAYRQAGVKAEVISGKTDDLLRAQLMRQFRAREIQQLVSVDILGEGVDVPAIEVVSMARPTQSYGLFVQQFGRALRTMEGKDRAIIIDHVGNVHRHGLPDAPREWSLDRRERRSRNTQEGVIPLRTCLNPGCVQVYERTLCCCPFCGFEPPIADRSSPAKVDGDLTELDPTVLAKLRGEIDRIERAPSLVGLPSEAWGNVRRNHELRQVAQRELKHEIATWAGWQRYLGRSDPEGYRRFFFTFGTDVATAQTLNAADASALCQRIRSELERANICAA